MKVFILKPLIVVAALLALVGCSTKGSITMMESVPGVMVQGESLKLDVVSEKQEAKAIAEKLKGQIATQIIGSGAFSNLSSDANATDFSIVINVKSIREVSGTERVMLGALAGSNKVAGDVSVTNSANGEVVKSFKFIGESASHPFSGKSDMRDAIERAAEEIMTGLRG
ncbi:MAG: DUF4410 domain-containing protein [Thalassolituus sp.]